MERFGKNGFVLDNRVSDTFSSPVCTFFRHLEMSGEKRCAAFPDGIPMMFLMATQTRLQPMPLPSTLMARQ